MPWRPSAEATQSGIELTFTFDRPLVIHAFQTRGESDNWVTTFLVRYIDINGEVRYITDPLSGE